jgi:nucleotide-binding universal stress UspA family protein
VRILVAVDGTEGADAALAFAIDVCKQIGAPLEVLTVKPEPPAPPIGYTQELPEVDEPEGAENIAMAAAETADLAGVESRAHVGEGTPAAVIVATAHALDAGLIVVGTRGLRSLPAALLGSVSRALITHSDIPVTIVPTPGDER